MSWIRNTGLQLHLQAKYVTGCLRMQMHTYPLNLLSLALNEEYSKINASRAQKQGRYGIFQSFGSGSAWILVSLIRFQEGKNDPQK